MGRDKKYKPYGTVRSRWSDGCQHFDEEEDPSEDEDDDYADSDDSGDQYIHTWIDFETFLPRAKRAKLVEPRQRSI